MNPISFTFWDDAPKKGNQTATIVSFNVSEKMSKKGEPYKVLSAKVSIDGDHRFVNLSNKRTEAGSSTNNLILQLAPSVGKTVEELIAMPASELFTLAVGKQIVVFVNARGYYDVAGPLELTETTVITENPQDIVSF